VFKLQNIPPAHNLGRQFTGYKGSKKGRKKNVDEQKPGERKEKERIYAQEKSKRGRTVE